MIPDIETFTLRTIQKDSFGKVTGNTETTFKGVSDEETVYDQTGATLNVVGKGMVYTSNTSISPVEGDEIVVNGATFIITKQFRAKVYGTFHHWEIVYG